MTSIYPSLLLLLVILFEPKDISPIKLRPSNITTTKKVTTKLKKITTATPKIVTHDELLPDEKTIELTFQLLENATTFPRIDYATLVLGNTGAGKTTLTKILATDNSLLLSIETGAGSGKYNIKDPGSDKIGDSNTESKTLVPELFLDPESNIAFYDCPGFRDTRGTHFDIAATFFTHELAKTVENVRLVFVVQYISVEQDGDREDFPTLLRHISDMVRDLDRYSPGMVLVVTKVPNNEVGGVLIPENVINQLINDYMQSVLKDLIELPTKHPDTFNEELRARKIQILEIFLVPGRVVILRSPDKAGPLSEIELVQTQRVKVYETIKSAKNIPTVDGDFGFTVSDKSKTELHGLVDEGLRKAGLEIAKMSQFWEKTRNYTLNKRSEWPVLRQLFTLDSVALEGLVSATKNLDRIRPIVQLLKNCAASVGIQIPMKLVDNALRYDEYLKFFFSVGGNTKPFNKAHYSFDPIVRFTRKQARWGTFMGFLDEYLYSYEVQVDREKYNVSDVHQWGTGSGAKGIFLTLNNFGVFFDKVVAARETLESFKDVKEIVSEAHVGQVNLVLNDAVRTGISCKDGKYYGSVVVINTLKSCGSEIVVFATNRVYFSGSVTFDRSLTVIAPYVEVILGSVVELKGVDMNSEHQKGEDITQEGVNYKDCTDCSVSCCHCCYDAKRNHVVTSPCYLGYDEQFMCWEAWVPDDKPDTDFWDVTPHQHRDAGGHYRYCRIEGNCPEKNKVCVRDQKHCNEATFRKDNGPNYVTAKRGNTGNSGPNFALFAGRTKNLAALRVISQGGKGGKGAEGSYTNVPAISHHRYHYDVAWVGGNSGKGGYGGPPGAIHRPANTDFQVEMLVGRYGDDGIVGTSSVGAPGRMAFSEPWTPFASSQAENLNTHLSKWNKYVPFDLSTRILEYKNTIISKTSPLTRVDVLEFWNNLDNQNDTNRLFSITHFARELIYVATVEKHNQTDHMTFRLNSFISRLLKYDQASLNYKTNVDLNCPCTFNSYTGPHWYDYSYDKDNDQTNQGTLTGHHITCTACSYIRNIDTTITSDDTKKATFILYTLALTQLELIQKRVDNSLIIDITGYVNVCIASVEKFQVAVIADQKEKLVEMHKNEIDDSIKEGEDALANIFQPAIDAILVKLETKTDEILQKIKDKQAADKATAEQLERDRQVLVENYKLKKVTGAFKIVGGVLSIFGKAGALAGALVTAGADLAGKAAAQDEAGIAERVESAGMAASAQMSQISSYLQSQPDEMAYEQQFQTLLGHMAHLPEYEDQGIGEFRKLVEKYRTLLMTADYEALSKTRKEMTAVLIKLGKLIGDKPKRSLRLIGHDDDDDDKPKSKKEIAEIAVKAFTGALGVVGSLVDYLGELQKLEKGITNTETIIKDLGKLDNLYEAMKKKLYTSISPMITSLTFVISMWNSGTVKKLSQIGVEVNQWKISNNIREVRTALQDFVDAVGVEVDFSVLTDLDMAMNRVLSIQGTITAYQNDKKTTDLLHSLSKNQLGNGITGDLKKEMDKATMEIQSNTAFYYYNRAKEAFVSFVFPFAHRHLGILLDPSAFDKSSLAFATTQAKEQLMKIQSALELQKSTINSQEDTNRGYSTFTDEHNSTVPFFVWDSKTFQTKIDLFLQGKPIYLNALVVESPMGYDAIRFQTIHLELRLKGGSDEILQSALSVFRITMNHTGLSYYRFDNKFYIISNAPQSIQYHIEKGPDGVPVTTNGVYKKLKSGDYALSPYTSWRFQLRDLPHATASKFSTLARYIGKEVDLVLVGNGVFVEAGVIDAKGLHLERYYRRDEMLLRDSGFDPEPVEVVHKGRKIMALVRRRKGKGRGRRI